MNPWVPIVLGMFGAVVTAFGAWVIAKRQRSGKIDTTEAKELWQEGAQMRSELRAETVVLRAEVTALRAEVAAMRLESAAMREEMVVLREESAILRRETLELRAKLLEKEAGGE